MEEEGQPPAAGMNATSPGPASQAGKRRPGRPALHQGCQVCGASLEGMRSFHQRYHICEQHMMADEVQWKGIPQRFCQQCGRFHPLDSFSAGMRSCKKQLAKHAERRRRGREMAAAAKAAAAAAAGGGSTGRTLANVAGHTTAAESAAVPAAAAAGEPLPLAKRLRPIAEEEGDQQPRGPTSRPLQEAPPLGWRMADSRSSSDVHQPVPESGMDVLLAVAGQVEEEAEDKQSGAGEEDPGERQQQAVQPVRVQPRSVVSKPAAARPRHMEPDLSWFSPTAAAPVIASAAALPAGGDSNGLHSGPAGLAAAAAPSAAAAALAPLLAQQPLAQQPAASVLAQWLQQCQQAAPPPPWQQQGAAPTAALQHLLAPPGAGPLAAASAMLSQLLPQQALSGLLLQPQQQQQLPQQQPLTLQQLQLLVGAATVAAPPPPPPAQQLPLPLPAAVHGLAEEQRQLQREQHVAQLFRAAVDRLLLGVLAGHAQAPPPPGPQ